jgi:hypothetical protein
MPGGEALAALVGGLVGVVIATYRYRQKQDELFFKALDFMKGGSQERNVGLAAIELYWRDRRRKPLSIGLLTGSAIYLLVQSKRADSRHEHYNLQRIMNLLLEPPPRLDSQLCFNYRQLSTALDDALRIDAARTDDAARAASSNPSPPKRRGLAVSSDDLKRWKTQVDALRCRAGHAHDQHGRPILRGLFGAMRRQGPAPR